MRNPNTGLYEYSKFFKNTGATVTGAGETAESAKADYLRKLEAYKKQPLVPTGEELRSPGFVTMSNGQGRVNYGFRDERKARILARPELAEHIQKERDSAKGE